jgi:hypothetical protein
MLRLIIWAGVGAGLEAMMGYFGRCSSGSCPLTSAWWRGAREDVHCANDPK